MLAAIAVCAWVSSYRRSADVRRDPDLFLALADLENEASPSGIEIRAAAVIEEKRHLEIRAGWPSAVVAAAGVMSTVLMVQDPSNAIGGGRLQWLTSELLIIAAISIIWTLWCVHRASRLVLRQRHIHRSCGR
ncbi:hypothetical protein [Gordonia oryzae]|nr:hypothetical protein [Gordonia oryzae]